MSKVQRRRARIQLNITSQEEEDESSMIDCYSSFVVISYGYIAFRLIRFRLIPFRLIPFRLVHVKIRVCLILPNTCSPNTLGK